ncbi:MAG TPA: hypothetical protein DCY20_11570 [Firmicutes bacterium]|nr:hypothetical protein [Bacillota bacterium]
MGEFVFILIFVLKEVFEMIAIKRNELNHIFVRIMLGMISIMMMHLIMRGVLAEWPNFIQIIILISLICDIIVICSHKLLNNLGGNKL